MYPRGEAGLPVLSHSNQSESSDHTNPAIVVQNGHYPPSFSPLPLCQPATRLPAVHMASSKVQKLSTAVEDFLRNNQATCRWPEVAAAAQQLHTAMEDAGCRDLPQPQGRHGNIKLFDKIARRKLLRRLGYWKTQAAFRKANHKKDVAAKTGNRIAMMWNVRAGLGAPDASMQAVASFCNELTTADQQVISFRAGSQAQGRLCGNGEGWHEEDTILINTPPTPHSPNGAKTRKVSASNSTHTSRAYLPPQDRNCNELTTNGAHSTTMVLAHIHDEVCFRVKSYTDHEDAQFAMPGGPRPTIARGKSTKIQNNVVTAFFSPGADNERGDRACNAMSKRTPHPTLRHPDLFSQD